MNQKNNPEYILVHCSDLSYKENPNQFYAINKWHKERTFPISSLGFYVGYHIVVSGGKIYKAREDWEEGAHCNQQDADGKSLNFKSLGICWAGDGDVELPTSKDLELIKKQILEWQFRYGIPSEKVVNHRKFTPWKTCAGNLIGDDFWVKLVSAPRPKDPEQVEKADQLKKLSTLLDWLKAILHQYLLKQ